MAVHQMAPAEPTRTIIVWDISVRGFHWLTVVLVIAAYVTSSRLGWLAWHVLVGEALLSLVLFRLVWGIVGSETARFTSFLSSPLTALSHLRGLFRREPDEQIGHNPAGGWMVLLLLSLLTLEVLSGVVVNNDVSDEGPLTELVPAWVLNRITDLHTLVSNALIAAVALHLAAILTYAVAKGHSLVLPMVTGRKQISGGQTPPRVASPVLALVALGGSVLTTIVLMTYL
jgi:cytochrome b